MKNKYIDLIEQSFEFPNEEFNVEDNQLQWHGIPLMDIIKQYGTPLRISYLPAIANHIQHARRMFNVAMAKVDYQGTYNYCYCTKSSHFSFVMETVLKQGVNLETSSAFDIFLLEALAEQGHLPKDRFILCNGFKRPQYVENIQRIINDGFTNVIPILDNKFELDLLLDGFDKPIQVGMRMASEEEPKFDFYTSRLGIRYSDLIPYYKQKIQNNPQVKLKMLHFFINTGIRDTSYYWNELNKGVNMYIELKKVCPELDSLNIGGGLPIQTHMDFSYEYEYMIEEIVTQVQNACRQAGVPEKRLGRNVPHTLLHVLQVGDAHDFLARARVADHEVAEAEVAHDGILEVHGELFRVLVHDHRAELRRRSPVHVLARLDDDRQRRVGFTEGPREAKPRL